MDRPVLGIVGGVGPLATAYFMEVLISKTAAPTDQENMPMIVINDPQIPDRTAYILDNSKPNPLPEIKRVVRALQDAGADYLAIPCNTAHYFFESIREAVDIPILSIVLESTDELSKSAQHIKTVGLLATEGTIASGVFQNYLRAAGLEVITPDADNQKVITSLIYDYIKAGTPYNPNTFLDVAQHMRAAGCDAVLVACTELSVIYQDLEERPAWLYDALDILAQRCVDYYRAHHVSA